MDILRAPNLDARNLADAWKKWKEELNLYIDLTMDDDNEPAKVKLLGRAALHSCMLMPVFSIQ
jgi:hypothetical protein